MLRFNDFYTLKKIFYGQEPIIFDRGITGRPLFRSAFFIDNVGTVQILPISGCELFLGANYFTLVVGSKPYYGTHYLYQETSLALPIMIASTTSDEYTIHIASNSLYS